MNLRFLRRSLPSRLHWTLLPTQTGSSRPSLGRWFLASAHAGRVEAVASGGSAGGRRWALSGTGWRASGFGGVSRSRRRRRGVRFSCDWPGHQMPEGSALDHDQVRHLPAEKARINWSAGLAVGRRRQLCGNPTVLVKGVYRPKPARQSSRKSPDARTHFFRVQRLRSSRLWLPGPGHKRSLPVCAKFMPRLADEG